MTRLQTYINITFARNKFFWFMVGLCFSLGGLMKWYYADEIAALTCLVLGIFLSASMSIGSYFYIDKNKLW
jgi:hypothetical protein